MTLGKGNYPALKKGACSSFPPQLYLNSTLGFDDNGFVPY